MDKLIKEPKTKRGEKTLLKILNASEFLFFEKGYHSTSIGDITKKAKIASGTFYIYFNDKYSLYKHLLIEYSHRIRKYIALAVEGSSSRIEMERAGLKAFLRFTYENKHAYNIIWESLYIDYNLFKDYYESFAMRYVKGIMASQLKKEVVDVDPLVVAYVLMGINNFVGLKYVIFDDKSNYDKVVDDVIKILAHGLFTEE